MDKPDELRKLQLALLENGFRHLKVAGVLVYSTCYDCHEQNEAVVEAFLDRNRSF